MEAIGPRDLGKLQLYQLPISGHSRINLNIDGPEIKKLASDFELVIPEYFPPEYQGLSESRIPPVASGMRAYGERNFLFEDLADSFSSNQKDVWVFDPAYDFSFALLRQATLSLEFSSASAYTGVSVCSYIDSLLREKRFTTRRGLAQMFLGSIAISTLTAAGFLCTGRTDDVIPFEDDLRATVISQALTQLQSHLEERTDALLIYPQHHLNDINNYLDNEKARLASLGRWRFLKYFPPFETLFQARHYPLGRLEGAVNPVFEV